MWFLKKEDMGRTGEEGKMKLPYAGTTQIRFKEYVSVTRRRHL